MTLFLLTRKATLRKDQVAEAMRILDGIEAHLLLARRALEAGGPHAKAIADRHLSLALELEALV